MGVSMSTLVGWVAVLGLFGYIGHREWSIKQRTQLARAEPQRLRQGRTATSQQKEVKKPKQPKENKAKTQGSDATKAKASTPTSFAAVAAAAPAQTYSYSSDDDRDAARNREFARQLSNVKQGTKFTGKSKEETRQKSVKQSRAEEVPVAAAPAAAPIDTGRVSAPSSTAGIDADDDSSSAATSPVLAATQQAGNVDDMLEKRAPGPSVIRLTNTEEKPNYKTAKPKAAPEPVETKKQRQNRKKAELAKAEREAAEKDRKVKLEAQRRTARLAEGRAAKDGSAFMAAQANKSNAWTDSKDKATSSGSNGFVPVQPLDTFDANVVRTDAPKSSVPSYDKREEWMASLPSEEEQMELLRDEDSWNTVKTKKTKGKKTKEVSSADEAPTPVATKAPAAAPAAAAAPAPVAAAPQKQRPAQISSKSSFAALAVDGAEEQEEEWDV
ncbi:hypothetical protein SBRCBS47491_007207 [Sporothrix bragantina]|uniref:Uncharacterized protein n=1 Tax=Sporothrix bragantina TaxID=671064 RepID=A0ABP0CDY9_9PEZI